MKKTVQLLALFIAIHSVTMCADDEQRGMLRSLSKSTMSKEEAEFAQRKRDEQGRTFTDVYTGPLLPGHEKAFQEYNARQGTKKDLPTQS